MVANPINMMKFNKNDSFFDYWNYNEIELPEHIGSKKTAEEIAEKIKLKQIYTDFPEHWFQLLFLS
jgi:hypothetical protein